MTETIDLSIIIVNWNTKQLLLDCLDSVYKTILRATFEVIVVDNGSTDGSVAAVAEAFPQAVIIANSDNEGFAKANNRALRRMRGTYAVLLNSDTVVKESALDTLYDFMENNPRAGMCGPQLLNADGTRQTSFGTFPTILSEFAGSMLLRLLAPEGYGWRKRFKNAVFDQPTTVDFIIGACMVVRKSAMEEVGFFDEEYFFFYEEIDWCYRMWRKGWLVYFVPGAAVYHLGGASRKDINLRARAESWRSRYLFLGKSSSRAGSSALLLYAAGFTLVFIRLIGYTLVNCLTLFSQKRLRTRWIMFGYLFIWHIRGFPASMTLPK